MAAFRKIVLFILINLIVTGYSIAQVKDTSTIKKTEKKEGPYDLQPIKRSQQEKAINKRQSTSYEKLPDTLVTDERTPLIDSAKNIITESSTKEKQPLPKYDSLGNKIRYPRVASIRSAILPGWGQIYNGRLLSNGRFLKLPIIYAALGGTAWYFFDTRKYYKQLQLGTIVATQIIERKIPKDSTDYAKITDWRIKSAVDNSRLQELKVYRDRTRRELDYAVVYFLAAWALNVVEASVDAHLQQFDISPNLSFNIQPGYSELAKTAGLSLVFRIK